MFFCLICEQVGCSTPPPPHATKMKRVWKSCLLCGHPAIVLHKNTKYKYNVQCGKRRDTLPQAASQQSFAFPWHGFVFFSVFLSLGVLGPVLYFGCFPTASRELPNCCNLARYYIYCLPDNYDDYLWNGVFKTFSASLGTQWPKQPTPPSICNSIMDEQPLLLAHLHQLRLLHCAPDHWLQFLADNLHYFVHPGGCTSHPRNTNIHGYPWVMAVGSGNGNGDGCGFCLILGWSHALDTRFNYTKQKGYVRNLLLKYELNNIIYF